VKRRLYVSIGLVVVLLVGIPVVDVVYSAAVTKPCAIGDLRDWAQRVDRASLTAEAIRGLPLRYRSALIASLTPVQRAGIVLAHMHQTAELLTLTTMQQEVLLRADRELYGIAARKMSGADVRAELLALEKAFGAAFTAPSQRKMMHIAKCDPLPTDDGGSLLAWRPQVVEWARRIVVAPVLGARPDCACGFDTECRADEWCIGQCLNPEDVGPGCQNTGGSCVEPGCGMCGYFQNVCCAGMCTPYKQD